MNYVDDSDNDIDKGIVFCEHRTDTSMKDHEAHGVNYTFQEVLVKVQVSLRKPNSVQTSYTRVQVQLWRGSASLICNVLWSGIPTKDHAKK